MKHILSIVLTGVSVMCLAQENAITLQDAIALTLEKNPAAQASALETSRQTALKKTSVDIPKTDVSLLYGQYNSIQKNDNNITISQSLPFPTVFTSQSSLNKSLITSAQLKETITRNDLAFQVKQLFNQILYLKARQQSLVHQDSLLTDIVKAATLQYKTGEGTLLSKISAETHLLEIKDQLNRNQTDLQLSIHHLQLLCQTGNITDVAGSLDGLVMEEQTDSISIAQNPSLAFTRQQIEVSDWQRKVEAARILPDIHIGYFTQTLIGTQTVNGQEQFYGSDKRFQGFQAGLSIPLWYGPHAARVKAAARATDVARKQEEAFQLNITQQYHQAQQELIKNKNSLKYFRESALPTAELLTRQSRAAFKNGELDYTTLLLNLKQAQVIRENYLTALQQYNQSIINLQYLNGTN